MPPPLLLLIPSLILSLCFMLYGFNHYHLMNAARRYSAPPLPEQGGVRPSVCVHLPVYNETYVIRRLVSACARMAEAYGAEKVRILVLDDSNDETSHEVDRVVQEYLAQHYRIQVVRRDLRDGFKAGALQAALLQTDEDFVAIFDADFIPPEDFLLRTIPYFVHDDRLGMIQSRWVHLNRRYNFLTRAISLGIDVHFLIEQTGRYAAGYFQNFNGSGGVLRTKAILQAGGWQTDTLAEDLDLSYRIQSQRYGILYLNELHSPGEVPPTVPSYKRQQGRWACGSLRTAKKLLPGLLRDRGLRWQQRLQAAIHSTAYMVHPMMLLAFILICGLTLSGLSGGTLPHISFPTSGHWNWQDVRGAAAPVFQYLIWSVLILTVAGCAAAPWVSAILVLKIQHLAVRRNLISLLVLFLIGYGVSLSNTIEAGKALLTNRKWAFARTPKYATTDNKGEWKTKQYQVPLNPTWLLEFGLVVLGALAVDYAARHSNFGILLFLVPYTSAYAFVFSLTILQSRNRNAW